MSGENHTEVSTSFEEQKNAEAAKRIETWRQAIDQELQDLLVQASTLRKTMNEAKTSVKREYYNKKFKKVGNQVMQLLAVQSQLPPREQAEPETVVEEVA